jgi:PAS domain S-box-containing protein
LQEQALPGDATTLAERVVDAAPIQEALARVQAEGTTQTVTRVSFRDAPGRRYSLLLGPHVDGSGELVMVATDTTEESTAEAGLRTTLERLNFAAQATGVGLWTFDARTGVIEWDEELRRLFDRDRAPADYAEYLAYIHPDDRKKMQDSIAQAGATGVYEDVEHRVQLRNGSIRWLYAKARVRHDENGNFIGMLGGAIDITSRKRLEDQLQQAQKQQAVGQLTAGIAHNFNNILTGILPNAQLVSMEVPDSLLPMMRDIEYSARRAAELVKQLMTFTRQRQPQPRHIARLTDLSSRTMSICRNTFPHQIQLVEHYTHSPSPIVAASGAIEQVLLNVLLNARDALQTVPEPRLEVRVESATPEEMVGLPAQNRPYLRVMVRDNGPGMDEETQKRIFEPFFTTKPPGQGTGLGLAVSYAIVSDHEGFIRCESSPNQGCTFSIYLPRQEALPESPELPVFEQLPRGSERILVVDDESSVRRVLSVMLGGMGYRVRTVADGEECLRALDPAPDLILLDLGMPGLSGKDLLPHLKSLGHRVLLLPGQQIDPELHPLADGTLEKPMDRGTLLRLVRTLLDQPAAKPL